MAMLAHNRVAMMLLAVNVSCLSLIAYTASQRGRGRPPPAPVEVEEPPHPIVSLDGTLVHLRLGETDASERHAAVQLDLEI